MKISLFERLALHAMDPILLTTQYRTHPYIAAYPSTQFYHGALLNGLEEVDLEPVQLKLAQSCLSDCVPDY